MSMYDRDWYRELIRKERDEAQWQQDAATRDVFVLFACPILTLTMAYLSLRVFVGNPSPAICAVVTNIIAFARVGRRKSRGRTGLINAAALVACMLGLTLTSILAFFCMFLWPSRVRT